MPFNPNSAKKAGKKSKRVPAKKEELSIKDAREKIEEYRIDYNTVRPHSSIFDLPPEEFIYLHQINPEFSS